MASIPILLLAAGSSTRMGQPKQLLPWGDKTIIEHQIQTLKDTGNPVVIVLGCNSEKIIPIIKNASVSFLVNENWEKGMGSSIAVGIKFLKKVLPNANGVIISLIDQPLVTTSHIKNLIKNFQSDKKQIVSSVSDQGWAGVPALFDKFYFDELANLNGKEGAKKIIKKHASKVRQINGGKLLEDMDTFAKYQQMLNGNSGNTIS